MSVVGNTGGSTCFAAREAADGDDHGETLKVAKGINCQQSLLKVLYATPRACLDKSMTLVKEFRGEVDCVANARSSNNSKAVKSRSGS